MVKPEKLITFMIITGHPAKLPEKLEKVLLNYGWQMLRPDQIYAIFWDRVLSNDPSDADKLMERVMEIHRIASQMGVNHIFKTIKTAASETGYPEIL